MIECVERCDQVLDAKNKEIKEYKEALESCRDEHVSCAEAKAKLQNPWRHPVVSGSIGAGAGALVVLLLIILI